MFFDAKKKIAGSIVDHFNSSLPREKSGKMDFSEAPAQLAKGGEAEDPEHMEALAAHSEEMHDAHKAGDHKRHARALKAFMEEHEAHKDVDNGPVSNEKNASNKIAGDEYK